jgi:hypothetical protein
VSRIWHEPYSLASVDKISLSLCHEKVARNILSFNELKEKEDGTRKWGWVTGGGCLFPPLPPPGKRFVCLHPA